MIYSDLLNSKTNSPIIYKLVLDIDGVLCQEISRNSDDHDPMFMQVREIFPEAVIIPIKNLQPNYYDRTIYFCYPNFDKLVLSIMSWPGWSVDIFSAGSKERNEELISNYFFKTFSHYSLDPKADYEDLKSSGKLQIFSYHHTIIGEKDLPNDGYEQYGRRKKDLSIISEDINNVIIADDDRSYILGSQYPYIGISESPSFIQNIIEYGFPAIDNSLINPMHNADYIMGIILDCKEKLASKEAFSLREALDMVISHGGKTLISESDRSYSPWFLHPGSELDLGRSDPKIFMEKSIYYAKMTKWIEEAENYFQWIETENYIIGANIDGSDEL